MVAGERNADNIEALREALLQTHALLVVVLAESTDSLPSHQRATLEAARATTAQAARMLRSNGTFNACRPTA